MNILVIGDSWSSAVRSTPTGDVDHQGWPQIWGLPPQYCQGVSGSTAVEWSQNFSNKLAVAIETPADVLIVSLLGNDFIGAAKGDILTPTLSASDIAHYRAVIEVLKKPRTIVIKYADPFGGANKIVKELLPIVNSGIDTAVQGLSGVEILDTSTFLTSACFTGSMHPNLEGGILIMKALKNLLDIQK